MVENGCKARINEDGKSGYVLPFYKCNNCRYQDSGKEFYCDNLEDFHEHSYYIDSQKCSGCGEKVTISYRCKCGKTYEDQVDFYDEYHKKASWMKHDHSEQYSKEEDLGDRIYIIKVGIDYYTCPVCGYQTEEELYVDWYKNKE